MFLKVVVIHGEEFVERAFSFVRENWEHYAHKGHPLVIQVVPFKSKRTVQQNKFYWGFLLHQISENAWVDGRRFSADTWHEQFKKWFLPRIEMPDLSMEPISTSELTMEEFSQYLDKIQRYAMQNLGIEFDRDEILWHRETKPVIAGNEGIYLPRAS